MWESTLMAVNLM